MASGVKLDVEPRLDELLADPVTRLLMRSDQVSDEDLRIVVAAARRALQPRNMPGRMVEVCC